MYTIEFKKLSTILLDFIDHNDGFLYLRMVGIEATVNAIWAKLSAKDGRGQKWQSPVSIPNSGNNYSTSVVAQKGVKYRTLRTRLPNGMIDIAMVHPDLTVSEDNSKGFYLLSYDDGVPPGFYNRLNRCLQIPIQPEWTEWLWKYGLQTQSFLKLEPYTQWEAGQRVEKKRVVEATRMPILKRDSLGTVFCYIVQCDEDYQIAWLQIIRNQLNLSVKLKLVSDGIHTNGDWSVEEKLAKWKLMRGDEVLLSDIATLNYLMTQARDEFGVSFELV